MENRDLFKEAIADAKTIKETALANAKATLEESFAPFLKEKLAAKLAEIDEQEVEEAEEKEVKEAEDKVEEGLPNIDPGVEPKSQLRTKPDMAQLEEEDIEEEIDLEELLAELEKDMSESEDVTESEDVAEAEDVKEDIYEAEEDEKEEESEEPEDEESEGEEEEIDLEDLTEPELKKFIEGVIEDMVNAGELEAGESFEDDVTVDVEPDGGLDIEDDMETAVDENKDKKEMEEMKKELYELKEELHEVNLLNSKLLYVNKIFRGKNLTENQKVKVLGAFDKATTVAEVKLVFETLSESLTTKKAAIKENLGSASKPMGAAPKKPILEVNDQFSRWQKLAGIK